MIKFYKRLKDHWVTERKKKIKSYKIFDTVKTWLSSDFTEQKKKYTHTPHIYRKERRVFLYVGSSTCCPHKGWEWTASMMIQCEEAVCIWTRGQGERLDFYTLWNHKSDVEQRERRYREWNRENIMLAFVINRVQSQYV